MDIERKQLLIEMGQRYLNARKANGLTQEEAADIANVTQQAISGAELGKSFLSPDSMLRLCTAYGISCDYLLTGKISDKDALMIHEQIMRLDADAFYHYKEMTEHFIAALSEQREKNS